MEIGIHPWHCVRGTWKEAKNENIKVCSNVKETYEGIWDIIESEIKDRHSLLHLSGYLFNP